MGQEHELAPLITKGFFMISPHESYKKLCPAPPAKKDNKNRDFSS